MKPKIIDHIFNTHLHGHKGLWELRFEKGKFVSVLEQKRKPVQGNNSLDAQGGMAIAPFVEPHIHLDTTQTAGDPRWNLSGTLFEGINIWTEKKRNLNHEDIKTRAMKTLKWQISQGIQYVRTHVDICDPQLKALKAMLEIKQEIKPWVNLQIVAFPQEGILSYSHGAELLEESLVLGADCVGAIPHCEFTREYGIKSLEIAMRLAQKYGRMIDVHCDEIDDEQSRFLETLATLAYEHSFGNQVTASHTTAMHSYNSAYMSRLFRILKLSNINFVSNPLVNIHLQGRFDDYPKRRGITRVKELLENKINVCFGHDDILDPWYSLGTGNMLQVLHMGLHVCHMMGYQTINESLDLITTRSARTLQLSEYGLQKGNDANLVILPVDNAFEAIRRQIPIQYSIRNGKILVENIPSNPCIFLDNPETPDYSYSTL